MIYFFMCGALQAAEDEEQESDGAEEDEEEEKPRASKYDRLLGLLGGKASGAKNGAPGPKKRKVATMDVEENTSEPEVDAEEQPEELEEDSDDPMEEIDDDVQA